MNRILSFMYFIAFNYSKRKVDYINYCKLIAYKPQYEGVFPLQNNCLYGNYQAIKIIEKKHLLAIFNYYVEHGVVFNDSIGSIKGLSKRVKTIYTFSKERTKIIKAHFPDKHIVPIGPYIYMVPFFKKKSELDRMKAIAGKTLVVFPAHGLDIVKAQYDEEAFLKEIKSVAIQFETVYICLHYIDILKGKDKQYASLGYKVLCAGHKLDIHFINRLKDIIYLSDMTMSNSLGTHLGYSVCMHRPHYYYKQKIVISCIDEVQNQYENKESAAKEIISVEASSLFTIDHAITNKHLKFVYKYWGVF